MSELDALKRILERERLARKKAEEILEAKSLELYHSNHQLQKLNLELEEKVRLRTQETADLSRFPAENINPVMRVSIKDFIILYANKAALPILELWKTSIGEICSDNIRKCIEEALHNKSNTEIEISTNNKFYALTISPIPESNYANIYGNDITNAKKALESLSISEERYRKIIESASDIIYRADIYGKMIYSNPIASRITEYSQKELEQMHFTNLVRKDYCEKTTAFYEEQLKNKKESSYFEFPIITKSGKEVWLGQNVQFSFNKENKAIEVSALARDITARKKADDALLRSEEKYRSIIANMNLGLLEVDSKGNIMNANERFYQILGFPFGTLTGKNAINTLLPDEYKNVMQNQQGKRDDGLSSVYEIEVFKADGSKLWTLISGTPLYNDKDEVIGSIGIHLDISEHKKTLFALEKAKKKAESTAKAKETFLANMSHEIRTPMNAIMGMSNLLAKSKLDKKQQHFLKAIRSSSENLLVIINDILDFSKIEAGKMTLEYITFNLEKNINLALDTIRQKAEHKNIELNTHIDPNIHPVLIGDPVRLNQIITNLLSNAVKFTENGKVSMLCNLLGDTKNHNSIQFIIKDTGIGISKNKLDSIFESFHQEDSSITRNFGGTGLGLTITKQLVELFDSSIHVVSEKGKGSTFSFIIQFQKSTEELPSENPSYENEKNNLTNHSVLLVEDHEINRFLAQTVLENWEMRVDVAENGKIAVDKLKTSSYDIVLMDMQMPVMSGIEATKIIRKDIDANIPIIALTANAIKGDNDRCIAAGMNDYISKPFDVDVLYQKIANLIDKNAKKEEEQVHTLADTKQEKPLYDLVRLENLAAGNTAFVSKMIQMFLDHTPPLLEEMLDAYKNGKLSIVKSIAHRIKPSVDTLNILDAKEDIRAIEKLAHTQIDSPELNELVYKTIHKLTQVCDALKAEK